MYYQNEHKITMINDDILRLDIGSMTVKEIKTKIESYLNLFDLNLSDVELTIEGNFTDTKRNNGYEELNFSSCTILISVDRITNKYLKVKYQDDYKTPKIREGNLIPDNTFSGWAELKIERA